MVYQFTFIHREDPVMQHYLEIFRGMRKLAAALTLLALCLAQGQARADELCIKSVGSASAIDGIVAPGLTSGSCVADTLWPAIGPAEFQPGGSSPAAYLRVARITSGNRLRLGIDVAGDDDVSNFDAVLLFFDANNDNTWDNQDFAVRIFVSPSDTVINSGEACDLATGTVEYFQFNSTESNWISNATAAAQITANYAYDYTAPDPENDVWNLEFEFPISASGAFQLNTTGDIFAVGGYLFADDGHLQSPQIGSVRAWPLGVVSALTSVLPDISFASSPLQVTAPAASMLGNINLESSCFDVSFSDHSWQINGIESESGDNHINKTGQNRFRIGYYFDGPGDDPQPLSNPGNVRMDLMPFRAGGWQESQTWSTDIAVNNTPYNYNQLHMADEVTLNFPGEFDTTSDISEICADLYLEGFQMNDNTSNDNLHINHNYFVTSTYDQTIELSTAGIADLQPGQSTSIWMQIQNNNEHPDVRNYMQAHATDTQGEAASSAPACSVRGLPIIVAVLLLILLLALLFTRKAGWKKPVWVIWVLLLLLLVYLLYQHCAGTGQGGISTPRWTITNAGELGIKPLAARPGWYEVPLVEGETKQLKMRITGQPLPYTRERLQLQAAANGEPGRLDIPVTPGQILTVIATGEVDLDGKDGPLAPTLAGGFTEQQETTDANAGTNAEAMKKFYADRMPYAHAAKPAADAAAPGVAALAVKAGRYPLTEGYYQPHQFAGALAGWFHGNDVSSGTFVLGRATSIAVPEGVTTLSLFVNAQWATYATIVGFYDLVVISTPAPTVPTRTVPGGDATYRTPLQLPPWLVLTSINLFTYLPDVLKEENVLVSTTLVPLGDAHLTIYDSHVQEFDENFAQVAEQVAEQAAIQ
jgi:hypothetical protein